MKFMKKFKLVLLLAGASLSLAACQITDPVDVASGVVAASQKSDLLQSELGAYSTNQDALNDLTLVKSQLLQTMQTGDNFLYIESYHLRILAIYSKLKEEINDPDNWMRLSESQKLDLISLDNDLIALNKDILSMKDTSSMGFDVDFVQLAFQAATLLTYYKGL